MATEVILAPHEMLLAANVGVMRQVQNLRKGRKDSYGFQGLGWEVHILGACAELAVAKLTGTFWNGALGNLSADDVGELQVRYTDKPNGRLIVHPKDQDDKKFVLVRGAPPKMLVVGWMYGRDAKKKEYWDDPTWQNRPAYFVDNDDLVGFDG